MNKIIKLDNGLRLWIKPMNTTRSIAVGVFIGAGCIYEDESNSGIAHFIEHMVFKGTKKRSAFQISEEMESKGIQINAYTSKGHTAFYTIATDEYAEDCVEMLSDLYFNATFTEENIKKEKSVVIEEIGMSEDDPEDVCLEQLSTAHFGNHPVANKILGNVDSVKKINKTKIKDFMHRFYTKENTLISIVGNIEAEKAIELCKKYFVFEEKEPQALPELPECTQTATSVIRFKDLEQANIAIGFPQFSYFDDRSISSALVSNLLGGGMSSRLFQRLREELGMVYNVYATDYQYSTCGYSVIFLATGPATAEQAVLAVKEVLQEVREKGFCEQELKKAKAQFKAASILAAESSSFLMRTGGRRGILMDTEFDLDERIAEIESVTLESAKEVFETVFDLSKASFSYVGKECATDFEALIRG